MAWSLSSKTARDEVELNFLDNALISFSLRPDWGKFLALGAPAPETPDSSIPR